VTVARRQSLIIEKALEIESLKLLFQIP
jgi:hypothetical protein